MASVAAAEAASQLKRDPAVVSGQGQGPPVSVRTIKSSAPRTPTPSGGASNTPPASVGSPARRTTHPAPADSSSNASSAGNPQHRPVSPDDHRGVAPGNQGRHQVVFALLMGYNVTVLIGIIPELERIVGNLSTAAQVAYGVGAMVAAVLLAIASMAAVINDTSVTAFCAKLGAIVCSDLLVVAISTKFGRWGGVAAAPSAAAVTCVMTAMWILRRDDEHGGVGKAISATWGRIVRLFAPPPEPGEPTTSQLQQAVSSAPLIPPQ